MRIAILLSLCLSGCFSVSARVRGGPTLEPDGERGYEAGLSLGLGVSLSQETSVRAQPAVVSSERHVVAFQSAFEIDRLGPKVGLYAGFAGEIAGGSDERIGVWAYGGALYPLWYEDHYWAGHEKLGGAFHRRSALGVGLEARVGTDFAVLPVVDWSMHLRE